MAISTITARVLFAPPSPEDGFLPEGPRLFSLAGRPTLGWVNIQHSSEATAGSIWLMDVENGTTRSITPPGRPGFFVPVPETDEAIVGLTKQIGTLNLLTGVWTAIAEIPDANPRTIINDAEPTPDGRFIVFGTKDTLFQNTIAHLYAYDVRRQTITILAEGQTCSNGKIIHADADGYVLDDIDTPTQEIRRFRLRVDPPRLEFVATVLDLKSAIGFPDGMVEAGKERALIAFYNPEPASVGLAMEYDLASGQAVREYHLPGSPRVTCPMLADWNGRRVAIFTTAIEGMPPEQRQLCPNAGSIFIADAG